MSSVTLQIHATLFKRLLDFIKSCTAPDVLSEKWDFLGEHDDWLRIDMPPSEFVAALEQDYTVEALIELGLYERVDDELRLPSWLDGDAPLYVAIDEDNSYDYFFPPSRVFVSDDAHGAGLCARAHSARFHASDGHSLRRRIAGCCRSHAAARAAGRQQ